VKSMAFATVKGGVGKTTLAVHTAAALADSGKQVLLIDLDPQAHASLVLCLDAGDRPSIGDALGPRPKHSLDQVLVAAQRRPTLHVAPACPRMAGMERELMQWGHRLQAIPRSFLSLSQSPDVVVIDTPPSLGAYTEAALAFADLVVAPAPPGAFALQGLAEVETAWRDVRGGTSQLTVVVNMWDRRTKATNDAIDGALRELAAPVLRTRIPRSEAINQAGLGYELVFDSAPSAPGAAELKSLAAALAERVGLNRAARAA
jgi:chromosome partitioning protein